MKNNLIIETDRLILRPFTIDDIEPSYLMNLDPEVSKYTGDGGIVDQNEIERRIREDVMGDYQKYGFGRMAVELKNENNFIGFCGLKYLPEMDEVDLGYRFIRKYWGRGFATEAGQVILDYGFVNLQLDKIIGLALPENKASINVLQKLGFQFEKNILYSGLPAVQYNLLNPSRKKNDLVARSQT